ASDVGGVAEQVLDGVTGYRVGRGDVEGVRSKLAELIASADLRKRLGDAGRQRYEQHFTYARMFARTVEVYQGLVSKPRVSSPDARDDAAGRPAAAGGPPLSDLHARPTTSGPGANGPRAAATGDGVTDKRVAGQT